MSTPRFLRSFGQRLGEVFADESSWLEFFSGFTVLLWCVFGLMDGRELSSWASMKLITDNIPEPVWLGMTAGLALLQLVGVLYRVWLARWVATFVMAWWWATSAYAVWQSVGLAPQVAVYLGWALPNCLAIFKHGLVIYPMFVGQRRRATA